MQIRFIKKTNIRTRPDATDPENLIGQINAGSLLEVADQLVAGRTNSGVSQFFMDGNGWYYWVGGAEVALSTTSQNIEAAEPTVPIALAQVQHFQGLLQPSDSDEMDIPSGETRPAHWTKTKDNMPIQEPITLPIEWSTVRSSWGVEQLQIRHKWLDNHRGQNIKIALLSTGIDVQCLDLPRQKVLDVWVAPNCGDTVQDEDGTGTQAAVIAAGSGQSTAGVAPEAQLLIAKIGRTDRSVAALDLVMGLDWAIESGADIVAILVDLPQPDPAIIASLEKLVEKAADHNITLVAPVGHSTERQPQQRYPAVIDGVWSIGAHDQLGQKCYFSAKSYRLDLLAPGESLATTSLNNRPITITTPSGAWATAFTAGCIALAIQAERNAATQQSAADRLALWRERARFTRTHTEKGKDVEIGYGLLQID
jgi:subtilisin family serine protease